jgi:maleate cis-trans isomerase
MGMNKAPKYTADLVAAEGKLCKAIVAFDVATRYNMFNGINMDESAQETAKGHILAHLELARRYASNLIEAVAKQDVTIIGGVTPWMRDGDDYEEEDIEPDIDDEPPPDVGTHAGAVIREYDGFEVRDPPF